MKGKIILFWLVLIGGAGAFLFQTAYQVQGLEEELVSLNRQIVREQESIQILKAEWSYLNTPTRLEKLAREYLQLQPSEARQFIAKADSVPMRPEQPIASEIIRAPRLPVAMPLPAALPAAAPATTARGTVPAAAPAVIPAAAPAPVKAPKTTGATALASIPAAGPAAVVAPRAPAPAAQPASTLRPPQPSAPAATAKPQNPAPAGQRAPQPTAARGGAGTGGDDPMGMLIARLGGTR